MSDFKWYIVQTQSNKENMVAKALKENIKNKNLTEFFNEVMVPEEETTQMVNGKKRKVKKRLFPGYVLVEMNAEDKAISVVKNTKGVVTFVGGTAHRPSPITKEEADEMLRRKESGFKTKSSIQYEKGDKIKVIEGPFATFSGDVDSVNGTKVTVSVSIFGRPTPLELSVTQIEKRTA